MQDRLSARERRGNADIGAVTGHEGQGNFQRLQSFGDRKTLFTDQPDIEQGESRRAIDDHLHRPGHGCRDTDFLRSEAENCVLEVERDDQIILDNQHIVWHEVESDGFHETH